jgi:hypothetical protein
VQEGYTLTARRFLLAQMKHTASLSERGWRTGFLRVLESDVVSSCKSSHTPGSAWLKSTKHGGAARCRVERGRLHTRATSIPRQRCHSADSGCVESLCARAHTHTQLLQTSTFAHITPKFAALRVNDWSHAHMALLPHCRSQLFTRSVRLDASSLPRVT